MGTWTGFGGKKEPTDPDAADATKKTRKTAGEMDDDDRRIRFTIGGAGRRMTKEDFIKEMQSLDPKSRMEIVTSSDAPREMKDLARKDALDNEGSNRLFTAKAPQLGAGHKEAKAIGAAMAKSRGAEIDSGEDEMSEDEGSGVVKTQKTGSRTLSRIESPSNSVAETPAERRRRQQALKGVEEEEYDVRGKEPQRETPADRRRREASASRAPVASRATPVATPEERPASRSKPLAAIDSDVMATETGETPAEKRRREAALGMSGDANEEDSEDDNTARVPMPKSRGIRFAEEPVRGRT
jgi:hypothetical protein